MLARTRVAELMDDPALDPAKHREALRGLERLNILSGSASSIWTHLNKRVNFTTSRPLKVLDIATGSGDIPIKLWQYAEQNGGNIEFTGADISATAIGLAKLKVQKKNIPVSFIELDVLNDVLPVGFDVIITSLFTHHLDPPQVIGLLKKMQSSAGQLVIVNDLIRSNVSLAMVWLASRFCSRSEIVHFDGPASVRGAYTANEMKEMAVRAGLNNCSIHSYLLCRQLLVWKRPL